MIALTDSEINSYLKFLAGSQVPVGIADPILHAAGNGRVTGTASVDLDAVRTQKKRTWSDPLAYLSGRVPIAAAGNADDGERRRTVSRSTRRRSPGVTIPKSLLQELSDLLLEDPERPDGINMDDPFRLPAAIQEIRVGQGAATIVQ